MVAQVSEAPGGPAKRRTAGLIVRWIARGLMIPWGGFWLLFSVADGIADWQQMHSPMALLLELLIPLAGLVVLAVAWRWELVGGIGFLAMVVLYQMQFHYSWSTPMGQSTIAILLGPSALTGLLLIISWLLNRRPRQQQD
jgi:hypothetical protein